MSLEGSTPSQNDTGPIEKQAISANQGDINPPPAPAAKVNSPRRMDEQHQPNQKGQQAREIWKFRLEVATALFLGITVIINWYIWGEMKDTAHSTKVSADAAAAATAAWITLQSFEYVRTDQDKAVFKVVLKNVGNTPATEVKSSWEFAIMQAPDLALVPKINAWQCPEGGSSPAIVSPDGEWETYVSSPSYTPAQLKMVANRIGRIFIHGCAQYHDVISPKKERVTELAVIYPTLSSNLGTEISVSSYHPYMRMK